MSDTPENSAVLGPNPRNQWRVSAAHADLTRPLIAPRPLDLPALPKAITVDAARSAVIVVDMQNDFCHEDGWLAGIGVDVAPARAAIEPINALLPAMRALGMPVIWLNWGNRPDLANISPALQHVYNGDGASAGLGDKQGERQARVLERNSWSAQLVEELTVEPGDIRVDKHRMSGFWDTPLDAILRNLRVDTLFFCGVNADQCVLHTLADANFLGYDTVLVEQATTTTSPDYCLQATLYNVRQIFGFTVEAQALAAALAD
ncbi:MAG: isochorismatase family cysteine hydrolase [Halieaceae bacterium]|jgi:nicotinamidase-related amidase|nr:isochorismatase family cysteine hydrolase [Halieaceae bacterium]